MSRYAIVDQIPYRLIALAVNVHHTQRRECFAMLLGSIAVVFLKAIPRVDLTGPPHQLALDDLGEAARKGDRRDECVSLCKGSDPSVELVRVFEPINDVNERDARLYGAEFLF
jgi:hypothetical protein